MALKFVMQHIERGTLQLWAFLEVDENIQKIMITIRIMDPFSIVKFECLDQLINEVLF